jgi:hypothetical protein
MHELKGPGLRAGLEVRRLWRCPQCSRTVRQLGDVVAQLCHCADPPVWMHLVPEPKRERPKFDRIVIPEPVEGQAEEGPPALSRGPESAPPATAELIRNADDNPPSRERPARPRRDRKRNRREPVAEAVSEANGTPTNEPPAEPAPSTAPDEHFGAGLES